MSKGYISLYIIFIMLITTIRQIKVSMANLPIGRLVKPFNSSYNIKYGLV